MTWGDWFTKCLLLVSVGIAVDRLGHIREQLRRIANALEARK